MATIQPVILSGGAGTRLWPLSRALYPKQLIRFPQVQPETFLAAALKRLGPGCGCAPPVVVCNNDHRFLVKDEAARAGVEPRAIVLEPMARNTAPAVAVAALLAERSDPEAILAVMPSDHVIRDEPAFVAAVRKAGAGVQLIPDGDIAGVIWTTDPAETGIDVYFGIGGAPEGVLAAAALRCIGGQMQGRLHPLKKEEETRAAAMGIADIRRKFTMEEMASGDVIFSATGVTDGSLLDGVHFRGNFAETETVVLRSKTGTVRRIKTSFRMIGTKAAPGG